jgi:hypothetical protein
MPNNVDIKDAANATEAIALAVPGTAGTPSADVHSVQGISGGTAMAVIASTLPLPSGAATAAKQPALGSAGTPSLDVITVQGAVGGTPQPVIQRPSPVTYNAPVVVSVGLTSTLLVAANANRKSLLLQNRDTTNPIDINLAGGTAVSATGFRLGAGESYSFSPWDLPAGDLTAIAIGAAVNVTVHQGV